MSITRSWDGAEYDRLSTPMELLGREVLDRVELGGDETVLDAARAAGDEDPFAEHLAGWPGPWNFAAPQDTERRLRAAGFTDVRCRLVPRPVTPDDPHAYLAEVVLGAHLERLPEALREPFVAAVAERLGDRPTIAYVRLNIDAAAG